MAKEKFFKGPKLLSLAKQKARQMGLAVDGMNLQELICKVQEREGNTVCFRKRKTCTETLCCWQASCGAVIPAS
jgi:hypothetical protein